MILNKYLSVSIVVKRLKEVVLLVIIYKIYNRFIFIGGHISKIHKG
jgi:hypothetical protein